MATSNNQFARELREMLEELRPYGLGYYHPLVNGEIETMDQLRAWCRDFYIRDVAVLLARAYAKCPHLDARKFIAENLCEEEGKFRPGRSHPELSARLPKHFGMTDEEIEAKYRARQQAPAAMAYRAMSEHEDWLEEFASFGLGAEYFAPALFSLIADRLHIRFGLPKDTLEFFYVHLKEDEDHARRTMEIVTKYAASEADHERVKAAVRRYVMGAGGAMGGPKAARRLPDGIVAELRSGRTRSAPRAAPERSRHMAHAARM